MFFRNDHLPLKPDRRRMPEGKDVRDDDPDVDWLSFSPASALQEKRLAVLNRFVSLKACFSQWLARRDSD
ncbi:MAG: hypothetical protein ACM3PZ_03220 [Bacillota bacterium]